MRLDHLVLVPGSLLPFKAQWQAIADGLPTGEVLVILPTTAMPMRRAIRKLVPQLRASGRRITAIPADQFA